VHAAANQGHAAVLGLLLDSGGEVSAKDDHSATPLHYAAFSGHVTVVQLLFDRGADVQTKAYDESTPEDAAIAGSHPREQQSAACIEIAVMLKAEVLRRVKCEAFAMGQLERLGAGSRVRGLEPEVVRMVLEHAQLLSKEKKEVEEGEDDGEEEEEEDDDDDDAWCP